MKWPQTLTFIRHGESAYNAMKKTKEAIPAHAEFKALYQKEYAGAKDDLWPSKKLTSLARQVWTQTRLCMSDYETPLTGCGFSQAEKTGAGLVAMAPPPDIIYVSPYLRMRETLEGLTRGWPALGSIKTVFEERIREQEHGLANLYNDLRVYHVLNPAQGLLVKLGDYEYRFLNGESKADVRDRMRSFLATLIREHAGESVFVISHHLTLLSLRANLERWTPEKFIDTDKYDKPKNCGVTVYRGVSDMGKDGRLVLAEYNKVLY